MGRALTRYLSSCLWAMAYGPLFAEDEECTCALSASAARIDVS